MSYLETYRTPAACYTKAPVRRETQEERLHRHMDQPVMLPRKVVEKFGTVNLHLKPGKAKFVKDVTYGQYR